MLARQKLSSAAPDNNERKHFERYGVYYTPAPGSALHEFGSRWFGYDLAQGDIEQETHGLDAGIVNQITSTPGRYGFHATLKAPFILAEGANAEQLLTKSRNFASARKSFSIGRLKPDWLSGALVLIPAEKQQVVNQFASQCVLGFEDFRAPLSVKERTRRMEQNLNLHQRLMLEELGYPYVMSEFRFHMTLTGALKQSEKQEVLTALKPVLDRICSEPCIIDSISLVGDPGAGQPFKLIERISLSK